jgi:GT2 family glycosyltransferase
VIYLLTVNYYSASYLEKLIASIALNTNLVEALIIVNNSPEDSSIYRLQNDWVIILEAGENLGFGKACNLGLKWIGDRSPNSPVWLINPDAYFLADSLPQAAQFLTKNPDISILGTTVLEPSGKLWFGGGIFNAKKGIIKANEFLSEEEWERELLPTDWVSGCSMLINLQNFYNLPQFDGDYFLYYEDFDFCRRYLKAGYKIAFTPQFGVIHEPSSITSKNSNLQVQYGIYSYLLSLEKHTSKSVLFYRLFRITLASLTFLSLNKFKAVVKYYRRLLNLDPP